MNEDCRGEIIIESIKELLAELGIKDELERDCPCGLKMRVQYVGGKEQVIIEWECAHCGRDKRDN